MAKIQQSIGQLNELSDEMGEQNRKMLKEITEFKEAAPAGAEGEKN